MSNKIIAIVLGFIVFVVLSRVSDILFVESPMSSVGDGVALILGILAYKHQVNWKKKEETGELQK